MIHRIQNVNYGFRCLSCHKPKHGLFTLSGVNSHLGKASDETIKEIRHLGEGGVFTVETPKYEHLTIKSALLKKVNSSLTKKRNAGWGKDVGAGFIKEDILEVGLLANGKIKVKTETFTLNQPINEFNLRETEEVRKFLKLKSSKVRKVSCVVCGGLTSVKDLASMPVNQLSGNENICKEHIEEIIDILKRGLC